MFVFQQTKNSDIQKMEQNVSILHQHRQKWKHFRSTPSSTILASNPPLNLLEIYSEQN